MAEMESGAPPPAQAGGGGGGGAGIARGSFFHRLMSRIRATPARVWISIFIAAGVLIITYLIYRQHQANAAASNGSIPGNGSGQPNWPTDGTSLDATELAQILQELQNLEAKIPPPAPPGGGKGGGTKTKTITLTHAESLNQIAEEQGLGLKNVGWLKSWNAQLKNLPGYNKTWWTLPAGTKVTVPIVN